MFSCQNTAKPEIGRILYKDLEDKVMKSRDDRVKIIDKCSADCISSKQILPHDELLLSRDDAGDLSVLGYCTKPYIQDHLDLDCFVKTHKQDLSYHNCVPPLHVLMT